MKNQLTTNNIAPINKIAIKQTSYKSNQTQTKEDGRTKQFKLEPSTPSTRTSIPGYNSLSHGKRSCSWLQREAGLVEGYLHGPPPSGVAKYPGPKPKPEAGGALTHPNQKAEGTEGHSPKVGFEPGVIMQPRRGGRGRISSQKAHHQKGTSSDWCQR